MEISIYSNQILPSLSSWGTVAINSVWIAFKSMFGSKSKKAGSTSSVLRYIQGNRPIVASQCLFQCTEGMHPNDISLLCGEDHGLLLLYESLMMRRVLAQDPDTRWCPAPNCTFAVVAAGCASCPIISCEREGCEASFCYHCKAEWHPNQTCDLARAQRQPLRASSVSFSQDSGLQGGGSELKVCPRCSVLIVKMDDGSCNHMTCAGINDTQFKCIFWVQLVSL